MERRWLKLAWAVAMAALVSGCAEFQFLSAATKEVNTATPAPPRDPATPDLGPRYKVGNAYQVKGVWYYPKADLSLVEEGIASWYGPGFHGKQTANGAIFDETKVSAAHRTLPMPSMVQVTNLENGRSIRVVINDRGPFHQSRVIDLSRRAAQLLGFETKGTALVRVEVLEAESQRLAAMVQGGPVQVATGGPEAPPPSAAPTAEVDGEDLAPPPGVLATIDAQDGDGVVANAGSDAVERAPLDPVLTGERVTVVSVPANPSVFIQAGAFSLFDNANRARVRLSHLGPVVVEEYTRSDTPLFRVRVGPLDDGPNLEGLLVSVIQAGFPDAHIIVAQN